MNSNRSRPGMAREHSRPTTGIGCIAALVFAIGLGGIGFAVAANTHEETHKACLVESKDRAGKRDGGSDMRVYTSCGVFEVSDAVLRGRFNSADVYAQLVEGRRYDVTTVGYRIPLISWFPNVLTASEVRG